MQDRIRFISHQGKEILLVDLSNCPANEVAELLAQFPTIQPYGRVVRSWCSQILLAQHLRDAVRAIKETVSSISLLLRSQP